MEMYWKLYSENFFCVKGYIGTPVGRKQAGRIMEV